ncbi:uncharacterized protein LOC108713706 isoform X1 [Xenopus laevis]|uniref:Uncharacterized protein LOC108713706 isoform X1 n=2 Tax=Xenopus laevis TaxID=8355 RepID=A0A8J1MW81_XENLA|nr:uncharacterized protein LOC108713706 isoform X1 [Xenopus laevis]
MGSLIVKQELATSWGPPKLICFLLISLSLPTTDCLKVVMSNTPIKSLKDQEVFVPCTFSDFSKEKLDLNLLSVHWIRKTLNGSDEVYLYVSGTHTPTRPGSYISDSEIIRGNVALHLPRVQFTDEGEYTCTVFYTPNKQWGHSTLQVSVQPTGSLQPPAGSVLIGTEKRVQCEANGFYPKDITIQWVKRLSETNCISLDKDSCTGDTSGNEDGTFNAINHLTISPSLEDDGRRYLCIIKHRSLENELKLNFTLSVTEPPHEYKTLIAALVGTFLGVLFLGLCYFLYWKFLKKEPPKLSPITGAEDLVHMNKATLSCLISEFRPKPIRITLCLQRNGGEEMEIDSWDSGTQTVQSAKRGKQSEAIVLEEREGLLINGEANLPPAQRPLQVEMVIVITTSKFLISSCQCTIHITPDIEEDDGAELTVRVTHSALRLPDSVSCPLKVNGVKPKLSEIVSPPCIIRGEPLYLICDINGFKPKPLSITWLKLDFNGRETELLCWNRGTTSESEYSHQLCETNNEDQSNSFLSILTMKPTLQDHKATFICRTHHYATESRAEKNMQMLVSVVPTMDPINRNHPILFVNETMEFFCKIHSFHPETLEVDWYRDDEHLSSHNGPALPDNNGLFYCSSRITYTPCVRDIGKKFRCEVSHQSLQNPKCVFWKLKYLISEPSVSAIKCDPEVPECNQPATLSCTIEKLYPEKCTIQWYQRQKIIESTTNVIKKDPESELYTKNTEMQFIPTMSHHGVEFHVDITHKKKTIKRSFTMKLKDLPDVTEVTYNKEENKPGKPVTLTCQLIGCNAQHFTAQWQVGGAPIEKEMRAETQTGPDSVSFLLTLMPTAEHYGKLFTCLLRYKDLPQPIKKSIYLEQPLDIQN